MPLAFVRNGRRLVALAGVLGALSLTAVTVVSPATPATAADDSSISPTISATPVAATATGKATVSLINKTFSPASLTVTAGTKVTWINKDTVAHTVTSGTRTAPGGDFDASLDDEGDTFSFVFSDVGTFKYFCQPHANMNAQIVVVPASTAGTASGSADGTASTPTTVDPLISPPGLTPAVTAPVVGSATNGTEPRKQDIELIQTVRTADLWESVAGQQAMTKGSDPRVRDIGDHIQQEHMDLDLRVRDLATKLNVDLPTQPNVDQAGWLKELDKSQGREFDQIFVSRLRFAHGGVFQKIAEVRANTTNDDVRAFATAANIIVTRHMTYLESTNLVDFTNVNNPGSASFNKSTLTKPLKSASASASAGSGGSHETILLVVAIAFVLILLVTFLIRGTMT